MQSSGHGPLKGAVGLAWLVCMTTGCAGFMSSQPIGTQGRFVSGFAAGAGLVPVAPPRQAPAKKVLKQAQLLWPVKGRVSSNFGKRWGRQHQGIDIAAKSGTPVKAAAAGRVVMARFHPGYGKLVVLRHAGGLVTIYAHHKRNLVKAGQHVKRGQTIALVGQTGRATGPHLHFEVRRDKKPLDPKLFLSKKP